MLPYIEQDDLFKEYRFDEPWDGPHNRTLAGRIPKLFQFHGTHDPADPVTNYLAVVGSETAWPGAAGRPLREITDGTDETILLVENRGAGVHWMEPRDLLLADLPLTLGSPAGVSSRYRDPAVVTVADSVVRLTPDLAPATLRALLTVAGGERLARTAGGWEPLADGRLRP